MKLLYKIHFYDQESESKNGVLLFFETKSFLYLIFLLDASYDHTRPQFLLTFVVVLPIGLNSIYICISFLSSGFRHTHYVVVMLQLI